MKNISLALLAIILTSSIVQGSPTTYTCATHPMFLKASSFLTRISNGDAEVAKKIQEVSDAFSANTPAALTAADLGVCQNYAGEQTCCTKDMVELLDVFAVHSVAKIQQNGTGANKLIYALKKVLDANSCGSSANTMSVKDFLANSALTNYKAYYDAGQNAKVAFSKLVAGMNRGSLCAICTGVDKYDTYFAQSNLQINADNIDTLFQNAIDATYDDPTNGLIAAINNTTAQDAVIDELLTNYMGTCTPKMKTQLQADIKTVYGTLNAEYFDANGDVKCSGLIVFGEKPTCDTAQDGDPLVESRADNYIAGGGAARRALRMLEDLQDGMKTLTGGLMAFIPNPTSDNVINAAGDYTVTWPNSNNGNNNNSNNNGGNNFVNTTTSVSRIHFVAITLLFAALAL